mgnify:CR=1 FL=1
MISKQFLEILYYEPLFWVWLVICGILLLIFTMTLYRYKNDLDETRSLEGPIVGGMSLIIVIAVPIKFSFMEIDDKYYKNISQMYCSYKTLNTKDALKNIYGDDDQIITELEYRYFLSSHSKCVNQKKEYLQDILDQKRLESHRKEMEDIKNTLLKKSLMI